MDLRGSAWALPLSTDRWFRTDSIHGTSRILTPIQQPLSHLTGIILVYIVLVRRCLRLNCKYALDCFNLSRVPNLCDHSPARAFYRVQDPVFIVQISGSVSLIATFAPSLCDWANRPCLRSALDLKPSEYLNKYLFYFLVWKYNFITLLKPDPTWAVFTRVWPWKSVYKQWGAARYKIGPTKLTLPA